MLGVDVGGTFTDVVSVRDGRIEVTKVPSSATDPSAPVVEGAQRLGLEDAPVFNHASTMGLNAVITRSAAEDRVPDHGGAPGHPRPRTDLAAAGASERHVVAAPVRRRGQAARPALPAARNRRAPAFRRERARPTRRGPGAGRAGGAEALRGRWSRDLPAERIRRPGARAASARARARGARRRRRGLDLVRDLAAGEGVRAGLDDRDRRVHEADLHLLRAPARRSAPGGRFLRRTELRRLRRNAAPLGRGARAAVPDRLRRAGRRDDVEPAPGRGARRAQPRVLRRRRDLHRRLARGRRGAVRRQHLRARARPDHQRALDRDLQRRRRRRQHRLDLCFRRRARRAASAGSDPGPAATAAAVRSRP